MGLSSRSAVCLASARNGSSGVIAPMLISMIVDFCFIPIVTDLFVG